LLAPVSKYLKSRYFRIGTQNSFTTLVDELEFGSKLFPNFFDIFTSRFRPNPEKMTMKQVERNLFVDDSGIYYAIWRKAAQEGGN